MPGNYLCMSVTISLYIKFKINSKIENRALKKVLYVLNFFWMKLQRLWLGIYVKDQQKVKHIFGSGRKGKIFKIYLV